MPSFKMTRVSIRKRRRDLLIVAPYEPMTADDERYAHWWMVRGCLRARDSLITQCVRIVRQAADSTHIASESDRDDLECELLLHLSRNMPRFDPERGRLSTFAWNVSMARAMYVAGRGHRALLQVPVDSEGDESWAYEQTWDTEVDDRPAIAMRCLPQRLLELVLQRFYEGMTLDAMGALHGITRERVRQLLCKAVKRMRDALQVDRVTEPRPRTQLDKNARQRELYRRRRSTGPARIGG